MPEWPAAAEEPERRRLLEVEPAYVRFRHELARQRDPVEPPDRRPASAARARSSTCCWPRAPTRRTSSTTPRRRAPRTSSPSTRSSRAAGGALGLEPRGVLALPARVGLRRPAPAARAGGRARGAGARPPTPSAGSRRPSRRSSARSRVCRELGRQRGLGRCTRILSRLHWYRRRRRGARDGARGDRDPRAARRVGRARPRLQRRSRSSRSSPRTTTRRSPGASGRSSSRPARRRPHARARARQPRQRQARASTTGRPARCSRRTPSPTPSGASTRRRARSATSAIALMTGRSPEPALRYARAGARLRRGETRCYDLASYIAPRSPGSAPRRRVGRGGADHAARDREGGIVAQLWRRRCSPSWPCAAATPTPRSGSPTLAAQAERAGEPQRIAPVLELETEWALTTGAPMPIERLERAARRDRDARRARRLGRDPRRGVGGRRRRRGRRSTADVGAACRDAPARLARPRPTRSARSAGRYDRALMLSLLDDEECAGRGARDRARARGRAADAAGRAADARARAPRSARAARGDARQPGRADRPPARGARAAGRGADERRDRRAAGRVAAHGRAPRRRGADEARRRDAARGRPARRGARARGRA